MSSTPTPAQLADIEACRALILEFAACIDQRQPDRMRELLADDATFARPTAPDVVIEGAEAIIATFRARPATVVTQHLNLNLRVRLTGADTAEADSVVLLYVASADDPLVPGKGRPTGAPLVGTWSDRFVRTAAGWRFSQRRGAVTLHPR